MSCISSALLFGADEEPIVELMKTPNAGLQPQAAVDSAGVIHLIYLYGDPAAADIGYVRMRPGDTEFSDPIRVNSGPGSAIAIGTVRGAHLAVGKSDRIHVAWNGSTKAEPKGPHNSAPMLYTRLSHEGQAFEPQRSVMATASGLDGGGTVAADSQGNVYVTWHAQGQENEKPIEGEAHRRVWLAHSADDGTTFQKERPVSPAETGACACCGMGALADQQGKLYLLYRTAREIVHRDMYLLISQDRGESFQSIDLHPWQIRACPMSTVSLACSGPRILLSWETGKQVYFTSIDTRSASIATPIAPPGESRNRKHPAIASNERGEILLAWTEGTEWSQGGSFAWQLFNEAGQPLPTKRVSPSIPAWDFATAIPLKNRFLVVS